MSVLKNIKKPGKWSTSTYIQTIVTFAMFVLHALGITVIPETMIYAIMTFVGAQFITGGIVKVKKQQQQPIITHRDIESFSGDGWFNVAEFKKSATHGNIIEHGTQYLTISSDKVRSYLTVQLRDANNKVLVIDQGSAGIPCRLKLADKKGKDLPAGNYTLIVKGDYGSSDGVSTTDRFSII